MLTYTCKEEIDAGGKCCERIIDPGRRLYRRSDVPDLISDEIQQKLFMFQLMGCLIFLVQFILLGAYTGAVGLAVNILRNLLLLKAKEWPWVKSKITLSALLVLLIGTTALT